MRPDPRGHALRRAEFPDFMAGLINGMFNAITDASPASGYDHQGAHNRARQRPALGRAAAYAGHKRGQRARRGRSEDQPLEIACRISTHVDLLAGRQADGTLICTEPLALARREVRAAITKSRRLWKRALPRFHLIPHFK
jgi:hypothetical protein